MGWTAEGSRIANATRSWQAAEDNPVTGWDKASEFIIALAVGCDTHNGDTDSFRVQWRVAAGSWANLGTSGEMKQGSATDLVNGNDVAAGEAGCASALTFEQEAGELEGANETPSITLGQDGWCEVQCAVDPAGALDDTVYEFRIHVVSDNKFLTAGAATLRTASLVTYLRHDKAEGQMTTDPAHPQLYYDDAAGEKTMLSTAPKALAYDKDTAEVKAQ